MNIYCICKDTLFRLFNGILIELYVLPAKSRFLCIGTSLSLFPHHSGFVVFWDPVSGLRRELEYHHVRQSPGCTFCGFHRKQGPSALSNEWKGGNAHQNYLHTPWKINMEHINHPFRKEHDLPNLHDYVPC